MKSFLKEVDKEIQRVGDKSFESDGDIQEIMGDKAKGYSFKAISKSQQLPPDGYHYLTKGCLALDELPAARTAMPGKSIQAIAFEPVPD